MIRSGALLAAAILLVCQCAGAVGFEHATAPDPADKPLELGIWYPSDTAAQPNTQLGEMLALNGVVTGEHLPLIVISHGNEGWFGSHRDTALALAKAGFIVVAVTHTGDNLEDASYPASRWMVDRPRHISRVIDYMLDGWNGHQRIDKSRIGIFGFSAGGYTALVTIGGIPDLQKAARYCAGHTSELLCKAGATRDFSTPAVATSPTSVWIHDPRVKAAVIAAPGFGFAFDEKSLAAITAPIQLWAMSEDHNAPYASNTQIVRRSLAGPLDFQMVEGGGHYAFLPACDPRLKAAVPKVWAMICVDPPKFDRAAFHERFNREVAAFFTAKLPAR